jgi:hypothetical protein
MGEGEEDQEDHERISEGGVAAARLTSFVHLASGGQYERAVLQCRAAIPSFHAFDESHGRMI